MAQRRRFVRLFPSQDPMVARHSPRLTATWLLFVQCAMFVSACGGSNDSSTPTAPTGTSTAAPPSRIIGLSGNLAFGSVTVGQTKTATLTITNSGNALLTWSNLTSNNPYFAASTTSGTVAAGSSAAVAITFSPSPALQPGDYSGTLTVTGDQTSGVNTIAVSGTGTAAATPPPGPTPTPTPPTSAVYHVWGGSNYSQYLGFFSCTFCKEFGADSINNEFGVYGSQFSSTSIRNQFGTYGSEFSSFSPCNRFAGNPPRVYNSAHSLYYGELTLNQFRSDAIKTTTIVNWLTGDVCKH